MEKYALQLVESAGDLSTFKKLAKMDTVNFVEVGATAFDMAMAWEGVSAYVRVTAGAGKWMQGRGGGAWVGTSERARASGYAIQY